MKVNRLKLPVGLVKGRGKKDIGRKKTTWCTPVEILGRIAEICDNQHVSHYDAGEKIREMVDEWRYS